MKFLNKAFLPLLAIVLISSVFILAGCNASNGEIIYHNVTFKQDGGKDVIIKVEDGKELLEKNIPSIQNKTGYTGVWDVTDFSSVKKSFSVRVIYNPNRYKIFYNLKSGEEFDDNSEIFYDQDKKMWYSVAVYDSVYTLKKLNAVSEDFGWSTDGTTDGAIDGVVWNIPNDVTVVAFKKSDSSWGPEINPNRK